MERLLEKLNNKQRQAVTAPLGPVLVLAGAGSGKTRVLTYRVAWLIAQGKFKPSELLALTFTNKAAGEMKERIDRILNVEYRISEPNSKFNIPHSITMGTFHSVCARLLRAEIEKLDAAYSRNFVIYDTDDRDRLLKQIVLELGLKESFRPQVFGWYISTAKNRLVSTADLGLENSFFQETLDQVYEIYQERLRQSNALDFDDLLKLTCDLFRGQPAVLKRYQERFQYVLVDEYQDTNHAQYTLLKMLTARSHNLFVVGDDAQSIYGFRGANMQNILNFKKDYPKAKVIMLEQNYRSTQAILNTAHKVIALNPFQYEKKLWTESRGGEKVALYEAADEADEAEFVLRRILNIESGMSNSTPSLSPPYQGGDEEGVVYESEETPILDRFKFDIPYSTFDIPQNLSDFVILYRTHAQSRPFEEALLAASVPYQIIGGIKFYERREIKDLLAYLRLVQNPKDLVSLARVINLPARGLGQVAFKEIVKGLAKYDYNFTRLLNNLDKLELTGKASAGAKDFFSLYSPLPVKNILDLVEFIFKRSGYHESLLKEGEEGLTRFENIEQLVDVAAKYKNAPWREGLGSFLEEVALMTDLDTVDEGDNKLTLMTLHSAKGLEFQNVFFVGLEEGLLPHSRSLNSPEEIAEEVRLAYVGITRAREKLYLSYARQRQVYGELRRSIPSRIIKAIPKSLLRKLNSNYEL